MDYYVDHSSSTIPYEAPGASRNVPYHESFYFLSSSHDAVPHLQRWAETNAVFGIPDSAKPTASVKRERPSSPSSQDLVKLEQIHNRLEFVYCNDAAAVIDASQSRRALGGVVDLVEDLIDASDYASLDLLLTKIDPSRLRPITNVAFLRTSYQAQDKLMNWKLLYQGIYAHLANSGQDPNRALRGLSTPRVQSFA